MELSVFKENPGEETTICESSYFVWRYLTISPIFVLINVGLCGAQLSGIYLQRTKCVVSWLEKTFSEELDGEDVLCPHLTVLLVLASS